MQRSGRTKLTRVAGFGGSAAVVAVRRRRQPIDHSGGGNSSAETGGALAFRKSWAPGATFTRPSSGFRRLEREKSIKLLVASSARSSPACLARNRLTSRCSRARLVPGKACCCCCCYWLCCDDAEIELNGFICDTGGASVWWCGISVAAAPDAANLSITAPDYD